jgi:hypothetical protein
VPMNTSGSGGSRSSSKLTATHEIVWQGECGRIPTIVGRQTHELSKAMPASAQVAAGTSLVLDEHYESYVPDTSALRYKVRAESATHRANMNFTKRKQGAKAQQADSAELVCVERPCSSFEAAVAAAAAAGARQSSTVVARAALLRNIQGSNPSRAAFEAVEAAMGLTIFSKQPTQQTASRSSTSMNNNEGAPSRDETLFHSTPSFKPFVPRLKPLCSICDNLPLIEEGGGVHISQCTNGHVLCYECSAKVIDCPVCRATNRARNTFAESYVKLYMGRTPTRCKHFRCKASMMMGEGKLYRHHTVFLQ